VSLAHHNLIAWQRADDLFITLHQLSLKAFPPIERFALASQLRRAAYSVAANIVEGFARPAGRGRVNFLQISKGSLAEVGYCVHAACRLGYISEDAKLELEEQIRRVSAPLGGLIRSEQRRTVGTVVAGVLLTALLSATLH